MNQTIEQKIARGHLTKTQMLAHRSLQYKWIPYQSQNLNILLHLCPFCQDALFLSKGTGICESLVTFRQKDTKSNLDNGMDKKTREAFIEGR